MSIDSGNRPETRSWSLEEKQDFSSSRIWALQRGYFAERGIDAWRDGEVPHYISSNPTIAAAYAEVVFSCWRDNTRLAGTRAPFEPFTVCELGAGSGRFAYHFVQRLSFLCQQAGVPPTMFRYVLTDQEPGNLEFWRGHGRFQSFLASGLLDIALFDANQSTAIELQISGCKIETGSLQQTLVVIANYLFDSIPQDLFYINARQCLPCQISLAVDADPERLDHAEMIARLRWEYTHAEHRETCYDEPWLQCLIDEYREKLSATYLLFPSIGLRCLQRLRALASQGLLLLSADKGSHRLEDIAGHTQPILIRHGSFSLNVNYHAVKGYCERSGGLALFPNSRARSLNVSACLMVNDPGAYSETQSAYQRAVSDFGPDDFYTVTRHAERHRATMSLWEILAFVRMSHFDGYQFTQYIPRLIQLAPNLDTPERRALVETIDKVWQLYFSIGEVPCLAGRIAGLFYTLDDFRQALRFFHVSTDTYGKDPAILFNMASCHYLLEEDAQARALLQAALQEQPDNIPARDLLSRLDESGLNRSAAANP